MYKDGNRDAVEREILASSICRCFACNQVRYEFGEYDGAAVSVSRIMTSQQYSIVSREAFEIYAVNRKIDAMAYILKLDAYSYYMMNILDYLVENTDRHWGNWGFLADNRKNKVLRLHDLMDFNQAFHSYDTFYIFFLLVAGYLKALKTELSFGGDFMCEVALTNKEISFVYDKEILQKLDHIIPHPMVVSIQEAIYFGDGKNFKC